MEKEPNLDYTKTVPKVVKKRRNTEGVKSENLFYRKAPKTQIDRATTAENTEKTAETKEID